MASRSGVLGSTSAGFTLSLQHTQHNDITFNISQCLSHPFCAVYCRSSCFQHRPDHNALDFQRHAHLKGRLEDALVQGNYNISPSQPRSKSLQRHQDAPLTPDDIEEAISLSTQHTHTGQVTTFSPMGLSEARSRDECPERTSILLIPISFCSRPRDLRSVRFVRSSGPKSISIVI